jgi:hypothetical protein
LRRNGRLKALQRIPGKKFNTSHVLKYVAKPRCQSLPRLAIDGNMQSSHADNDYEEYDRNRPHHDQEQDGFLKHRPRMPAPVGMAIVIRSFLLHPPSMTGWATDRNFKPQ